MIFKKAVLAQLQHRFLGVVLTIFIKKKHYLILGVLLAARCVFLQDAPGGAARGVCSDM